MNFKRRLEEMEFVIRKSQQSTAGIEDINKRIISNESNRKVNETTLNSKIE